MARLRSRKSLGLLVAVVLGIVGYLLFRGERNPGGDRTEERIAGVEVALVERRSLDQERTLSGALEAGSQVVVAPKVGGRIERLAVDLADPVKRGQAVAFLDDAEYAQEVKQAEAELAVAMANLAQARNALEISRRENQRIVTLRERGIASDSEYDLVEASRMEKEAQVEVAEAQVNRATAALESSRIRFEYTRVTADWSEGDAERMVAERFVDEGETVSANQPLLLIVQLDPILAVISVTERDYGQLQQGLEARFTTDAFPGEVFRGRIVRIAPVFRETSRQARVELTLANPEGRLKPGMFIRATITLDHVDEAVAVPEAALTKRGDIEGVFLIDESGERVRWVPVETGIRSRGWVELRTPSLSGRVVTLGQYLIDDGSAVRIVATFDPKTTP
jgi:RND family efflux transporter MFP subunit